MRGAVLKGVALVTLVVVLLTGCATMEANPKTTVGAVGGGALGGLIAAAAGGSGAAIAASVIGGMLVGGLVGNLLDEGTSGWPARRPSGRWNQRRRASPSPGGTRIAGTRAP